MLKIVNFATSLNTIKQPLLIAGDDAFLMQDATDLYVEFWQKRGYNLKHCALNSSSDWLKLENLISYKSLFVENKVIVCEFSQKSLTKKNDLIFSKILSKMPNNIKLVFKVKKIAAATKKAGIYQYMQELVIWPLKPNELNAWCQNQAKAFKIALDNEQTQTLISKTDANPIAIKNYLKIMHISGCKEFDAKLITQNSYVKDHWQILDYALTGQLHALHQALSIISKNELMSLFNICLFACNNLVRIHALIISGLNPETACAKIMQWPKQRQVYLQTIQRHGQYDWQKILVKMLELEFELKGGKSYCNNAHKLNSILFGISSPQYRKYIL